MTTTAPATRATGASADRAQAGQPLAGVGTMLHLVLRRNRVRLAVWLVALVGLFAYVAAYYQQILNTPQALADYAVVADVPSMRALVGHAAAPDTLGGAVWTKIWMTCALGLAFGVLFLVTRNGRADEEAGRTELLRSRMLGVHAYSSASWLVNAVLCVLVGIGIAAASVAAGLDPSGIMGSLVLGASVTGVGLIGLGVGALTGQVASTSRGANALGSVVLGGFYLLRMVGDLGDGRLTWASPIGWGQQMQPWGANRWWPFALLVGATVLALAVAALLESRRDLGAGLLPERSGRGSAPARYASPLGLSLRLQRGPIIGWALTLVLCALLFGSVVQTMTDLLDDAGGPVAQVVRGTGVNALLSLLIVMMALITTVFAIQSACTLRLDEASGIAEAQLAGARSRASWAGQRLLIPAVGSAVLLGVGGALLGASYGSQVGDSGQAVRLAGAALAYWPAVMVFVGLAVALFGWVPRVAVAMSWGVLAAMWFVVIIGDAMHLPGWLLDLLPFSATPYQPAEPMSWLPLLGLTLVAGALAWLGIRRFASRDILPG